MIACEVIVANNALSKNVSKKAWEYFSNLCNLKILSIKTIKLITVIL